MRNRAAVILVQNLGTALIKRMRDGKVYYVFPGGGIEEGETPKMAAKREALEELGVTVLIKECIAEIEWNGTQSYFSAEITGGTFARGHGEEYADPQRDRGTYLPVWVPTEELLTLDVRPKEVVIKILSHYSSNAAE
ncbi:NUDIX domain-containing protein [Jeotgalibacillus sp. ET6]|uniref:NUDIX hydrolase n=1 Tax=Jeotgalibacillus sp. ET6 TaxID=3037260 RepID=UPI002418A64C|nr:NUDIX domain-containing protein [Jeotgalibacillus sp. ET6]MDG5473635.1 NUDIX domain-containing protein [Jeotgalibacillus sp. ET6]